MENQIPELVRFELNNWMRGEDYPDAEPFISWMNPPYFTVPTLADEDFVRANGLIVDIGPVDMSTNYCITATKEWVEKNIPELLTTYKSFIREDEIANFYGFRDYEPENIGTIKYHDEDELD